jgi:glycosyltransferase involved in cell wall biosynthesis
LKVAIVSPSYFAAESVLGGGERFAEELARALSRRCQVRFVSFGAQPSRERPSPTLERVILRNWVSAQSPFSPRLFAALADADVIHCLQYFVLPTFLSALYARTRRRRAFVTDLGGGGWTPAYRIDQSGWFDCELALSEYAAGRRHGRPRACRVVYGGVDLARHPMRRAGEHDGSLVFLGRLLPHKGVHDLVQALPPGVTLRVLGSPASPSYLEELRTLSRGKDVEFVLRPGDEAVVAALSRAMALVHLTPVGANGSAENHELFGLALVEAMATGCPVVATRVASLPEIVVDGETGILLPAGDAAGLPAAIERLRGPAEWRRFSLAGRERVERLFSWDAVAERCLEAYGA